MRHFVWGPDIAGQQTASLESGAEGVGGLLLIREWKLGIGMKQYLPLTDGLGNVTGLLDASDGSLAAEYDYDPYGNPVIESITQSGNNAITQFSTCPFRHRTRYYDSESWLYYYGYRYYDPSTTKWISKDPLGEEGGWNLTCFCNNDPVNGFDPTGLLTDSGFDMYLAIRTAKDRGMTVEEAIAEEMKSREFGIGCVQTTAQLAVRTVKGIRQTGFVGGDIMMYGLSSSFGWGDGYQGNSELFNSMHENPSSFGTIEEERNKILLGTGKAVVNVGTLGASGIIEGTATAVKTGNYDAMQDACLQSLLLSTQAKSMKARGMHPWAGTKTGTYTAKGWLNNGAKADSIYRGMKLKNQLLYEIGQTTVKYFEKLKHMNPVYRGAELIERNGGGIRGGWKTLKDGSRSLGYREGTIDTGPTPAVRFFFLDLIQTEAVFSMGVDEDRDEENTTAQ